MSSIVSFRVPERVTQANAASMIRMRLHAAVVSCASVTVAMSGTIELNVFQCNTSRPKVPGPRLYPYDARIPPRSSYSTSDFTWSLSVRSQRPGAPM